MRVGRLLVVLGTVLAACIAIDHVREVRTLDDLVLAEVLNKDGRLTQPVLIGFYPEARESEFTGLLTAQKHGEDGYVLLRCVSDSEICGLVNEFGLKNGDAAVAFIQQSATISEFVMFTVPSQGSLVDQFAKWLREREQVELGLVSHCNELVDVYWVSHTGNEVKTAAGLRLQQIQWIRTFLFHNFVAKYQDGREIARYRVTGSGIFVIQGNSICNLDACDPSDWNSVKVTSTASIEREGKITEDSRLKAIAKQPGKVPHFTDVGFLKLKMPDLVFKALSTYYYHNKNSYHVEKWSPGSTFVNHRVAPTFIVTLPEEFVGSKLKQLVKREMEPIISKWSGIPEIDATAFYGIRIYPRGSVLKSHVDRASTHVVSAIFNVDQEVDEDWPLEIFDHAGKAHYITLQPGEMVLYESASCPHGRPTPFKGRAFVNCFIHFKPKDESLWPIKVDAITQ